ncbi:hypothetical protein SCUP234_11995 [Seiridium cupressi]
MVPIPESGVERFQAKPHNALTTATALSSTIPSIAPAIGAKHIQIRAGNEKVRVQHQVARYHNRYVGISRQNATTALVQSHQPGRTSSVD